ncbi:MAG: hypothetical protein IKC69_04840 [Clostridia bacterium]|nr:hypothetical protein [Clostridia bacterium]
MKKAYLRLKIACYGGSATMAVAANLPPVLFLTFRKLYGISFAEMGLLVLVNYLTQLGVDLFLTLFPRTMRPALLLKGMPVLSLLGFGIYGLWPTLFPGFVFAGLLLGTVIFSAAAGLGEVLISPVIASIPSPDPEKQMASLHSAYAWATIPVVILSALFLERFGAERWQLLLLLFSAVPLADLLLFCGASFPPSESDAPERKKQEKPLWKNGSFRLLVCAIFLSGAAECTMSQWASGYLESALGIPKIWGDVFGVALFALMMGIGRSLHSEGKRELETVLALGAAGTALCYGVASLTPFPILGLFACALTGLASALLWPGSLVLASGFFPRGGVFLFAAMAAGGDLGASVGPQLVGLITDGAMLWEPMQSLATLLGIGTESLAMRLALLLGMVFPLGAFFAFRKIRKRKT